MSKAIVRGSLLDVTHNTGQSIAESFFNADVLILLDNSGSMGVMDAPGKISRRQAAENELRRLQKKYPGKIALVCFADDVIPSPSGMIIPCGATTDMSAALRYALQFDDIGMKIILVTDGAPNSTYNTIEVAKKFKSQIDAIYIGPEDGLGLDFLNRLMGVTGGKHFKSDEPGMLAESVEKVLLLRG